MEIPTHRNPLESIPVQVSIESGYSGRILLVESKYHLICYNRSVWSRRDWPAPCRVGFPSPSTFLYQNSEEPKSGGRETINKCKIGLH